MNNAFIKQFKEQKERLQQQFRAEKTGEQTLFSDQARLFKPLTESQNQTAKAIGDKIASSQDVLSNTLVPFTRELQKRNEQLEVLQNLPYPHGIEDVPQSTPQKQQIMYVDLNGELINQTHSENLQDLGLDLPSVVQANGTYEEALNRVKTQNKKIGQLLGKSSKKDDKQKAVYESRKTTLTIYKSKIKNLQGSAKEFIISEKTGEGLRQRKLIKQKRGRGRPRKYPDIILYNNADDLCKKLAELVVAKKAGNTGLDNDMTTMLDELLNIKFIDKDFYDKLFKRIFS
jgi:hypothetical protein